MSRIATRFATLRDRKEGAFIPYITAGDPSVSFTADLIVDLAQSGADVIELGVPYSDPIADGPVNQAAAARALAAGTRLPDLFDLIENARHKTDVPLVLFTYCNPVLQYGPDAFFERLSKVGGDGIIMPDLPVEESMELREIADRYGIDLVAMVAPTSDSRIEQICSQARGFVYAVSSLGVTGVRSNFDTRLPAFVQRIRRTTSVPVAVGFGISDPSQARGIGSIADGAVVGSAIVRRIGDIAHALQTGEHAAAEKKREELLTFTRDMKEALRTREEDTR